MVTTLRLDGMRGVHCTRAVFTALAGVPGVMRAQVRVGVAIIDHDQPLSASALNEAVTMLGYEIRESLTETRHLTVHEGPPKGD